VNYIQSTKTELFTANFNWGYYNEDTKKAVEEFQRKNNLSVDGEVGVNTAKKLIEKVNTLGSVSGYGSGIEKLTEKEILEILKKVEDQIQKEKESGITAEDLKQAPTAAQIQQAEKEIKEDATNKMEGADPNLFKREFVLDDVDKIIDIKTD
jgi:hypothetical protein